MLRGSQAQGATIGRRLFHPARLKALTPRLFELHLHGILLRLDLHDDWLPPCAPTHSCQNTNHEPRYKQATSKRESVRASTWKSTTESQGTCTCRCMYTSLTYTWPSTSVNQRLKLAGRAASKLPSELSKSQASHEAGRRAASMRYTTSVYREIPKIIFSRSRGLDCEHPIKVPDHKVPERLNFNCISLNDCNMPDLKRSRGILQYYQGMTLFK
jgi:hypothetical protein